MYSRAFLRFWWMLALGLVAAVAVGGFVAKHHKAPTYSSAAQLLVDSAQHPFLRVSGSTTSSGTSTGFSAKSALAAGRTSDTQALVNAANFYPLLINSDLVATYRNDHYGLLPGTVKAKAVDAVQGLNRYVPSIFPIIEIDATSTSAENAIRLATTTATGFQAWLSQRQTKEDIPLKQRISVVPIVTPTSATVTRQTRYSLAIVAGAAIFAAFLGLVVLLDRVVPRRRPSESPDDRHVEGTRRVEVVHRAGL